MVCSTNSQVLLVPVVGENGVPTKNSAEILHAMLYSRNRPPSVVSVAFCCFYYRKPCSSKWLLLSWLLHKCKREFSDTNFEIGKPC